MESQRPPKSATEIAALPPLGTTECLAHLRDRGASFDAETVVYLLRAALGLGDTTFFELAGRLLVGQQDQAGRWSGGHCEGVIVNLAREFGFLSDPDLLTEFRSRCYAGLWKAIHGGKPFWEFRFGLALRQKCIECARAVAAERRRDHRHRPLVIGTDEIPDGDDAPGLDAIPMDEDVASRLSAQQNQETLRRALRALPERQGIAAQLAWCERRPVEGTDAASVASVMGITPRAVWKLLRAAGITLRADPAVRAIWFGEA